MTELNWQNLAEENLNLVRQAIHSEVTVNENIFGFEYDDLFQEGCIWLCKAAALYEPERGVQFATFARKVIANGLRTYCRLMCSKQKHLVTIPSISDPEEPGLAMDQFAGEDFEEQLLAQMTCETMLSRLRQQYHGTTRLGIEALRWKTLGYSGTQIAAMYGVQPNLVGAWISRAVNRIKQNQLLTEWMESQ